MSKIQTHIKTYKVVVTILILAFSLSPCSVKRDVLGIFDIQHLSTLNKVKVTSNTVNTCSSFTKTSLKTAVLKDVFKYKKNSFSFAFHSILQSSKDDKIFQNHYSGHATGNSPPKYILFKRLKLNLV